MPVMKFSAAHRRRPYIPPRLRARRCHRPKSNPSPAFKSEQPRKKAPRRKAPAPKSSPARKTERPRACRGRAGRCHGDNSRADRGRSHSARDGGEHANAGGADRSDADRGRPAAACDHWDAYCRNSCCGNARCRDTGRADHPHTPPAAEAPLTTEARATQPAAAVSEHGTHPQKRPPYPPAKENCRNTENFEAWKVRFRKEAAARGVSRQSIAIVDATPLATNIIGRDRKQGAIFVMSFLDFQTKLATPNRVQSSKRKVTEHRATFERAGRSSACPLRSSPASGRWRATSAPAWASSPFCHRWSPWLTTAGAARCSPRS